MKRRLSIPYEDTAWTGGCFETLIWAAGLGLALAFLPCHAADAAPAALPTIQAGPEAVQLDHWLVIGPFARTDEQQVANEDFLRKLVADEPIGAASQFDLKQWLATGSLTGGGAPGATAKPAAPAPGDAVASMTAWLQHSDIAAPAGAPEASAWGRAAIQPRRATTAERDLINLPYAVGLGNQSEIETDNQTDPSLRATAGLYYSACLIHSTKPATVYLMLGCDSPFVISLNGARANARANTSDQSVSDKSRVLLLYNYSFPLDLAAGDNLLLLRIDTRGGDAGVFSARLEPTKAGASLTALDNDGLTLPAMVITAGQPLPIRVRGAPSHDLLQAEIVSFSGAHVADAGLVGDQPQVWNSTGTAPGLYKVRIRCDGATFEKPFYIMKPGAQLQDLMGKLDLGGLNEETRIDLMTLQTRMEILCRPENWHPMDDEWQRKIAYTLGEIKSITGSITDGREPIKDAPGLHLRGFISAIDGQTECYRIFVPSGYRPTQAGGLPVVLIMPTLQSATRPFIASAFVAHQTEADILADVAEKKGCAVLWLGYRCQPTGNPCDFAHFDEVLRAAKQDYHIDDRRIYLTGECDGGALALSYNVEWPGRFAATGLINPFFHSYKFRHAQEDLFWPLPAYQRWLETEDDPVTPVLQSVRPSLLVIQDGTAEAGHGKLCYSLEFAAQAKAVGYPITLTQLPPALHYHLEAWSDMIDWMLPQRLDDRPRAQAAAAQSRLGPIARAFAGPFILVEGTAGTAGDQMGMRALSQSFQDAWRKTHYGPCRVAKDRALSDSEKAASNLILLGNASTNRIWREIEDHLPAKISANGILIGTKKWSGPDLSVQALCPNPYNPAKLVVVIGADDLAAARFGTMDLSTEGWYDFGLWRTRAGAGELVAADRYADAANFQTVTGSDNRAPPSIPLPP